MAIWSLTKERVDKLLKQIGEKEMEIDELIKLSKEDLWKRDLDDFINEWRVQLAEEHTRQKKVANLGRRASTKLKLAAKGPEARKRKAQGDDPSDSDFGMAKSKKPTVVKHVQPKAGMLAYLSASPNPKPAVAATKALTNGVKPAAKPSDVAKPAKKESSDDIWMQIDGAAESASDAAVAPVFQKAKVAAAAAATKKLAPAKKKVVSDDDEDEEISRPAPSRKPRAAAMKPVKYDVLSDSDDDDENFDIGNMVKGIGGSSADPAAAGSRPLFSARASMSRPGSSAGVPRSTTKPSSKGLIDLDDDETDYSKLAPVGNRTASAVSAKGTVLSDDEEEEEDAPFDIAPPPAKVTKAPAPKAAAKPVAKAPASKLVPKKEVKKPVPAPAAPAPIKKMPLSPAAKAYAAKQAKANATSMKKVVESDDDEDVDLSRDEVDDIANDILSDEGGNVPAPRGRPARRAAAATTKKNWVMDDDSEEESEEESEGFEDEDSE